MKKYAFCLCLTLVCHFYGMDQNPNYADLRPSAPTYSIAEKLKEYYPNLYAFATKNTDLESKLNGCSNPETHMNILFDTLEEKIIKQNNESQKVSIVQRNSGTSTQTISNCHFGGNVTQINSNNAKINTASNIIKNNYSSQTQKNYFSYAISVGGLFCLGLWWYLK